MERINKIFFIIACFLSFILPKKKMIYLSSFYGQYNDNPRQISETLHEMAPNISIYWAKSSRNNSRFPKYVRTVNIQSFRHYLYMFIAKVTIDNQIGMKTLYLSKGFFNSFFAKIIKLASKNQFNIGTWHGTPLKNIGEKCLGYKDIRKRVDTTNYVVSGCSLTEECLLSSFPKAFEVKKYGTPRNDVFFKTNNILGIKEKLKLPVDKKILLFAPTFRDNIHMSGITQLESINWRIIVDALKNKFGEDWCVVVRIHPHVMDYFKLKYDELLLNGNIGDDMSDYLSVADALLTDYSSSLFDYALTGKPCFLFTPDLAQYRDKERGFYFDFNKIPFPKSVSQEQLVDDINSFDQDKYEGKVLSFLTLIGNYEDGKASERIVNDIIRYFL